VKPKCSARFVFAGCTGIISINQTRKKNIFGAKNRFTVWCLISTRNSWKFSKITRHDNIEVFFKNIYDLFEKYQEPSRKDTRTTTRNVKMMKKYTHERIGCCDVTGKNAGWTKSGWIDVGACSSCAVSIQTFIIFLEIDNFRFKKQKIKCVCVNLKNVQDEERSEKNKTKNRTNERTKEQNRRNKGDFFIFFFWKSLFLNNNLLK